MAKHKQHITVSFPNEGPYDLHPSSIFQEDCRAYKVFDDVIFFRSRGGIFSIEFEEFRKALKILHEDGHEINFSIFATSEE